MVFKYGLCVLVGYLLGNIQTSVLISKSVFSDDVRQHGSGNAGSTNMLRVFGRRAAIFTFIGDFMKGVVAILFGELVSGGELGSFSAVCALAAVLGHNFPVFYGFRGGKGVATTLAVMWLYEPGIGAVCTAVLLAIIVITGMVSLGSLVSMTLFSLMVVLFKGQDSPVTALLFLVLWGLIVLRHKENIKRLVAGTESRLFK